jgi:RNA polymerase sigma-70 factor (ECF subfamily)
MAEPSAGAPGDGATGDRDSDTEQRLIEAAQRDPARFAELYDGHFHRIYAYVWRRVSSRAEAEDITSETFHQALENLPRFQWRGVPFAAWLYRIASNAISDHYRREARQKELPQDPPEEGSTREIEAADEADRRAQVFRSVAALPPDQRRVIQLRFAEERSIREVAEALGRSEGAVKQLQFRALQALRERVRETHV